MKLQSYKFILSLGIIMVALNLAFAQSKPEKAIELYDKGDYKAAIENLEKFVKENPLDAEAKTYLALALIKMGRVREAEVAFGKSLALDANQPKARRTLAKIFLTRGKSAEAARQAEYLISLDERDAEIYYILGLANLRLGKIDAALENAEQSLRYDDKFSTANLLKAQALMNRKTELNDYAAISAKFSAAAESLDKYVQLLDDSSELSFWREQRESLKYFVEYYDAKQKNSADVKDNNMKDTTPVKILTKARTPYTDQARYADVSGSVRLLVAFAENGETAHVLALTSLGYGLDEAAVKTAKAIKFEPETQNGKPVTAARFIEYSFTLY